MDELLKEIYQMVIELRKISQINNELLGFLCQKVSPVDDDTDTAHMMITSLEMAQLFEEYNVMPEEFGIS